MSDLEQIVRPSQNYSIRPTSSVNRGPIATPSSKVVTWGSSGSSIFQLTASISQNTPPAQWPKSDEQKRTFDVVRVMNPDDSSQHVDVEVMTSYQAQNAIDKSRITLNFTRTQPSQDIQIISTGNVRNTATP